MVFYNNLDSYIRIYFILAGAVMSLLTGIPVNGAPTYEYFKPILHIHLMVIF